MTSNIKINLVFCFISMCCIKLVTERTTAFERTVCEKKEEEILKAKYLITWQYSLGISYQPNQHPAEIKWLFSFIGL